jgi:poly-gamma-glutamate synthesis protein (capsule biosynthesis protein)
MRLALVGDVMLGRLVNDFLRSVPPAYPWGDTLPLFLQADMRFCNLECALSDRGSSWSETPKTFHFRSDAKNVAVLQAAGMDMVSLANNHTLDYGYEALYDTLDILHDAGIERVGAGRNLEDAARPAFLERKGVRFAFLAFTDNEPQWAAEPDRAGIHFVPAEPDDGRFRTLLSRIDEIRLECEVLIVSAHWGPNWGRRPPENHVRCAHAMVEHGVDLVFGHSCHVVQGIEVCDGRPILYGVGDFIDDYAVDPSERNDQAFVFLVDTDIGPWHLQLHPTVIRQFQATLAHGAEAHAVSEQMRLLCHDLGTGATWDPRSMCLRLALPPPPYAPAEGDWLTRR